MPHGPAVAEVLQGELDLFRERVWVCTNLPYGTREPLAQPLQLVQHGRMLDQPFRRTDLHRSQRIYGFRGFRGSLRVVGMANTEYSSGKPLTATPVGSQ